MRVLRRPAVEDLTGLARSTIYTLMARGQFPRPIELAGASTVGWIEDEVIAWIEARVKTRDENALQGIPASDREVTSKHNFPTEPPVRRKRGRPRKVRTKSLEHSA